MTADIEDTQTQRKVKNARINLQIASTLAGKSYRQVSEECGLSHNTIGKFIRGDTMLSFANFQRACDVLGIPIGLVASERQITPARIRLHSIVSRMSDRDVETFIGGEDNGEGE